MKTSLISFFGTLLLFASLATSALAADTDPLQGKWKADKKINGSEVTLNLEITKDKFTYEIKGTDGQIQMYVKGTLKLEKLGVFKTFTITDLEAGPSESTLQSVDETRSFVYATGWKSLTLASNFDRQSDNEEPELTVYRKQ